MYYTYNVMLHTPRTLTPRTLASSFRDALVATLIVSLVGYASYLMLEPMASFGQASDQFVVSQVIGSEISFLTTANDIALTAIGGITGGSSQGSTNVRVYTNDAAGFTMTITASNSPAMQGATQGGTINDYTPTTTNVPDFSFQANASGQAAELGYTVSASTTGDLAQKFRDNGSVCNTGSNDTSGATSCWYRLSTTATSTLVTTAPTPASGATSTLYFRVNVPANPSPALPEDTYYATSTLTATAN
jgi:hypothetical protein